MYVITRQVVAIMLNCVVSSGVYFASVSRWLPAFVFRRAKSAFLFPKTRYIARKNTPKISHGETITLIAYAPAAALITKFVAIVSMSRNASFFRKNVYSCDSPKYASALYVNIVGKNRLR